MKLYILMALVCIGYGCAAQNMSSSASQRVLIVIPPRIHVESMLQLGTAALKRDNKPITLKDRFNIQSNTQYTVRVDTGMVTEFPVQATDEWGGGENPGTQVNQRREKKTAGYIAYNNAAKRGMVYTVTEI